MDMDLVSLDANISEHRTRVAFADRFGPLLATGKAAAPSRRTSLAAVTAVRNLIRAVGAACLGLGNLAHDSRDGLRSDEHDLAALGMRWPTDAAYDSAVAAEARSARENRLAAETITPLAPVRPTRDHGSVTGAPRATTGRAYARASERLRVTSVAAVVGGGGQAGD